MLSMSHLRCLLLAPLTWNTHNTVTSQVLCRIFSCFIYPRIHGMRRGEADLFSDAYAQNVEGSYILQYLLTSVLKKQTQARPFQEEQ
jgi:hypothetical protein